MKKLWFGLGVLAFTSPILSNTVSYYAGISGGAVYNTAEDSMKKTVDVFGLIPPPDEQHIAHSVIPASGDTHFLTGGGQFQLGMGINMDFLYLGVEFIGQFTNGDFDSLDENLKFVGQPNSTFTSKRELSLRNFEPAIDFRPGVFLSKDILLYGRVGAAFNKITLEDEENYNLIDGSVIARTHHSTSDNVVGLRLGLGVEYHLHERLNILMDYTHTNYEDISLNSKDSLFFEDLPSSRIRFDTENLTEAMDITKHAVMIGINYYL